MAVNRERPHLLVLPEDDDTRSLAVRFRDAVSGPMQILNPARGWKHVIEVFERDCISRLDQYEGAHLVLLIDFDDQYPDRLDYIKNQLPAGVADRVYVLGALTEAETLRTLIQQKFEPLGQALPRECNSGVHEHWQSAQLRHNQTEAQRLHTAVRGWLF